MSSKYNKYARQANEMAREAVEKIISARAECEKARTAKLAAGHNPAAIARAEADYLEAEEAFKSAQRAAEGVKDDIARLRKELAAELASDNCVSSEDVDAAGVELMKSGICTPQDFDKLARDYSGNRTMQRLVAKYAENAAAEVKEPTKAAQYRAVSYACARNTGDDRLDAFDVLADVFNRTAKNTPTYSSWDMLTAEIVQNF